MFGAAVLGSAGLLMLAIALDGAGSIGMAVFFGFMSLPGLLGATQLVRGDLRRSAERRRAALANVERRILAIAATHQGRVSPALVTMEVPGLDIAGAKSQLDAMARDGFCTVDSDDHGRPFYTFQLGPPATDDASPEEWLKQAGGTSTPRQRMTGAARDEQTTSTEA